MDGDACPVRDEVYRVAERFKVRVFVVSNGARPIAPSRLPFVSMIIVDAGADKADDWIAERVTPHDVAITSDIPLASRCLAKSAQAVSFKGHVWTADNIGSALAGREVSQYLRESGVMTGGPAPFAKADRSRFLGALDEAMRRAVGKVVGSP